MIHVPMLHLNSSSTEHQYSTFLCEQDLITSRGSVANNKPNVVIGKSSLINFSECKPLPFLGIIQSVLLIKEPSASNTIVSAGTLLRR